MKNLVLNGLYCLIILMTLMVVSCGTINQKTNKDSPTDDAKFEIIDSRMVLSRFDEPQDNEIADESYCVNKRARRCYADEECRAKNFSTNANGDIVVSSRTLRRWRFWCRIFY